MTTRVQQVYREARSKLIHRVSIFMHKQRDFGFLFRPKLAALIGTSAGISYGIYDGTKYANKKEYSQGDLQKPVDLLLSGTLYGALGGFFGATYFVSIPAYLVAKASKKK